MFGGEGLDRYHEHDTHGHGLGLGGQTHRFAPTKQHKTCMICTIHTDSVTVTAHGLGHGHDPHTVTATVTGSVTVTATVSDPATATATVTASVSVYGLSPVMFLIFCSFFGKLIIPCQNLVGGCHVLKS